MTSEFRILKKNLCFGGEQLVMEHPSRETKTMMKLGLYLPSVAKERPVPLLVFLSGLTCTEENFTVKAGMQRLASQFGMAVVAPDTSPRGLNLPGENDSYDFGTGAGFYVNASQKPWAENYRMYSYVVDELPTLLRSQFSIHESKQGIFGHSMGGHGALVIALRNPDKYQSVSAFSPICAPMDCPWGQKAFTGYLGENKEEWATYDASKLVAASSWKAPMLVDQGTADEFLTGQLMPEKLESACSAAGKELRLRKQEGYDHSYYFIATFLEDHIRHHAQALL
jgi:S-formylglutathione hydrolase